MKAYKDCSASNSGSGPAAAWVAFRAFHVLYYQLQMKDEAIAVCEAGWEAYNSPETAWCAAFVYSWKQQHAAAEEWAKRAIGLGCFLGSCHNLAALLPRPSEPDSCSWEGPFNVLRFAYKGLGDEAASAAAFKREMEAKFARKNYNSHRDLYLKSKVRE